LVYPTFLWLTYNRIVLLLVFSKTNVPQDNDFGGWPDEDEMRNHIISPAHANVLRKHCSTNPMVEIPQSSLSTPNFGSPVPTNAKKSPKNNVAHLVTPVVSEQEVKMPAKVTSKAAIEMHKKWQQQASAYDPTARLVIDKTKAKELIFDALHDSFAPMNITQIHTVRSESGICFYGYHDKNSAKSQVFSFLSFLGGCSLLFLDAQGRSPFSSSQGLSRRYEL
jgi:hypothetical protein